jgi:putative two-component system response regulator
MNVTPIDRAGHVRPIADKEEVRPHARTAVSNRKVFILLVYLSETSRRNVCNALQGLDHHLSYVASAGEAMERISRHRVDLVLIDLASPESDGLDLCRSLKSATATQFLPVYVVAGGNDLEQEVRALEAGADEFLIRPLRRRTLQPRVQASLRFKDMLESLDDAETALINLAQAVEDRDPELGQHCHRLALMAAAMGLTLGLPAEDILTLQRSGYLHDIGKVALPDRILLKPGPLTREEWETMKTHAERGERICRGMRSMQSTLPIIRHHHERWDGSGYPDGLRGEEIPLLARILQLADIYDALITARPYKIAMSPEEALATIRMEAAKGWRDEKLVEVFADLLPCFPTTAEATDQSNLSLQALAASIERFRKHSSDSTHHAPAAQKFQLASGF